jgi:hypothetical protein
MFPAPYEKEWKMASDKQIQPLALYQELDLS